MGTVKDYNPMNMYAKNGTRVKYHSFPKHPEAEKHDRFLVNGAIYTVRFTVVHGWHTEVFLDYIPGSFNHVFFEEVLPE